MSGSFRIGDHTGEHVAVEVVAREHPDKSDYWDGNWLTATVDVACGPFRGNYRAALRAEEFVHFRDQLERLGEDHEAPRPSSDRWSRGCGSGAIDRIATGTCAWQARPRPN